MKIWNDCQSICKNEKGAYLVLVTSLLPLVFGFVGLAVDLGNFQSHTAKLQHASDAAALAGAAIYAANNETEDSHPLADAAAEKYLKANLGTSEFADLTDTTNAIRYQVKSSGHVSYYRVYIEENLNTSFIRLIGAPFFTTPAGEAFATIPVSKSSGTDTDTTPETAQISFDKLVSLDGELWGSFNNDNRNQISATFDGDIYCYNRQGPGGPGGHWEHWNPWDWDRKYRFYTGEARGLTPWDADQKGLYREMQQGNPRDFDKLTDEADEALGKLFSNETSIVPSDSNGCTLPTNSSTSNYYLIKTDAQNFDLNLSNFSGDQNDPVYIYIDGRVKHINVNLQENITRPIIFCYTGGHSWGPGSGSGDVKFHSNGKDFRGVIYTPYANYTQVNFENSTFNGSMITHNLDLSSNHGKFIFEEFGIPISGGGAGSGSSGGSSGSGSSGSGSGGSSSSGISVELKLVPDPGLDWKS